MEYKAKVVLSYDVYRRIKWLTHNFDKEIAAVGTGKIRKNVNDEEKHFYISKLYFPNQKVTGASVHITQEMWGDIIKKVPKEEWGDICFYWHKHPGSASHSSVDEEDTFETFMSPEAGRKWFVFLQTAAKGEDSMDIELRIELREPIRATLLGKSVTKLTYEITKEELKLRDKIEKLQEKIEELRNKPNERLKKELEEIIENCVEKDDFWNKDNSYRRGNYYNSSRGPPPEDSDIIALRLLFEKGEQNSEYMNNDTLMGVPTRDEEKVSIEFKSGGVLIKAGKMFRSVLQNALKPKEGKLASVVKRFTIIEPKESKIFYTYKLQPMKKAYKVLKTVMKRLFIAYNDALLAKWENEGRLETPKSEPQKIETKKNFKKPLTLTLKNTPLINDVLSELEMVADLDWTSKRYAIAYQRGEKKNNKFVLGSVFNTEHTLLISGDDIVSITNAIIAELSEQKNYSGDKVEEKPKARAKAS